MTDRWSGVIAEDEEILWEGQPQAAASLATANRKHLVIGALIVLFYLYALIQPRVNTHWVQTLFNVVMLGVGAVFVWDAVWGKPYRYARTHYAITDRHILIARQPLWGRRRLSSYRIGRSTQVKQTARHPHHVWFSTRGKRARMVPLRDLATPDRVAARLRDAIGAGRPKP